MLYAFQRLTLEQWGLVARLDSRVQEAHLGTLEDDSGEQTPPVEMPPAATPPVATSPVATASAETPPVESPPVETSAAIPHEWVVQIGGMSIRLKDQVLYSGLASTGERR